MGGRPQQQTGIRKGADGRYMSWCRLCSNRSGRYVAKEERAGGWFDTAQDALEQARRHRKSEQHQRTVLRLSSGPTQEEIVLARVFGKTLEPCAACGFHHSPRLDCIRAARVRDKEGLGQ